ncbi:Crp/Fnr family transcriptional regulator [Sulfitobacter alexandrii]|uniref:Crp/Fnr family transcriptional regulator n=1 Tax=Sulfitobacter alexandrii TaxID=1917485 RepID=A0A1J0WCE2_9RHOB|nr:Crp/Fnr family transcriptional regulator [Sulfitobacter alexandrii]APE41983.1 Crp/Fnr family transcriptional regulator [Sulfitobacter alexandrii]
MATKCRNCPLRQRDLFIDLSSDEVDFMQKFKAGELTIDPGTPILMEGSNAPQLFTVLSGMGIRDKMLENGERQVISFVFPGDFVGLQAGLMGKMGHSVEARTRMKLCVFDRSEFWSFFKSHPGRAFDITWLAAIEEHFLGETVATLGQRTATQALAWALIKVFQRGDALGLVENNQMKLPYTQRDLADALGLSLVHTNKTLAKLREAQLVSWSSGTLHVMQPDALAELGMTSWDTLRPRPLM